VKGCQSRQASEILAATVKENEAREDMEIPALALFDRISRSPLRVFLTTIMFILNGESRASCGLWFFELKTREISDAKEITWRTAQKDHP